MPGIARDAVQRIFVEVKPLHPRIFGPRAVSLLADMRTDRAEILGEPDMIVETDLLVAEEEDEIFGKGPLQLGKLQILQRPREIDISNHRADMRAAARHRERLIALVAAYSVHLVLSGATARHPAGCVPLWLFQAWV